MSTTPQTLPAETGGTDITRFNALRHGVLSRYTVLPWENADEYRSVVEGLVAEHGPHGPTEEHLVEEIAGILWRKRRLRLAEAAAHRRGLDRTLASYRETVKVALVHLDTTTVFFRALSAKEIERYVEREKPFDCAGGFKAEALGVTLFESIESQDPTALIGLPLIWLACALRRAGYALP